jgi:hypothetical protein
LPFDRRVIDHTHWVFRCCQTHWWRLMKSHRWHTYGEHWREIVSLTKQSSINIAYNWLIWAVSAPLIGCWKVTPYRCVKLSKRQLIVGIFGRFPFFI